MHLGIVIRLCNFLQNSNIARGTPHELGEGKGGKNRKKSNQLWWTFLRLVKTVQHHTLRRALARQAIPVAAEALIFCNISLIFWRPRKNNFLKRSVRSPVMFHHCQGRKKAPHSGSSRKSCFYCLHDFPVTFSSLDRWRCSQIIHCVTPCREWLILPTLDT